MHEASSAGDLPSTNKIYTGALYEYVDYDHLSVYPRDDDASTLSEEDCVVVVASGDVVGSSRLSVVDITITVW